MHNKCFYQQRRNYLVLNSSTYHITVVAIIIKTFFTRTIVSSRKSICPEFCKSCCIGKLSCFTIQLYIITTGIFITQASGSFYIKGFAHILFYSNDIDYACNGITTIQGRLCAFTNFNSFYIINRKKIQVKFVIDH